MLGGLRGDSSVVLFCFQRESKLVSGLYSFFYFFSLANHYVAVLVEADFFYLSLLALYGGVFSCFPSRFSCFVALAFIFGNKGARPRRFPRGFLGRNLFFGLYH